MSATIRAVHLVALLVIALPISLHAGELPHHELKVVLTPDQHSLRVTDTITLPEARFSGGPLHFVLHRGLEPRSTTPGVEIVRETDATALVELGLSGSRSLALFRATLPSGQRRLTVEYAGEIHHPLEPQEEEQARGFSETPGIISPEGVLLSGASAWYPSFGEDRLTFRLEVQVPEGWEAVSQGERSSHSREGSITQVTWHSPQPQEEIYLVAGPWTEYARSADGIQALAFLRTPDPALAQRYLEATAQYLEMYEDLIGPYPYPKFALVENFWETGYGMPSFTLLGSKVIRLPFIVQSSYPHEILHNWWGNGVYVDYESGNWGEGLTAYLADHLLEEQKGNGIAYREALLQKYADYVAGARDFPLTAFRSRHSPATEAVGYGKALMLFHMLRRELGDDRFLQALQRFYREHKFRFASFADLERAFASVAGRGLDETFNQWVGRTGAPQLKISDAKVAREGDDYLLSAVIEQVQPEEAYRLRVPLAVTLEAREQAYQTVVDMDGKRLQLALRLPTPPLRLDVDPELDLFRRLDWKELPPALSGVFGADRVLIVLSAEAPQALKEGYRALADSWQRGRPEDIEVREDRDLEALPSDRAVWLVGWENRFRPQLASSIQGYDAAISDAGVRLPGAEVPRADHSVVVSAHHPADPDLTLNWLATDNPAALPGLGRKLPHYHKYSYLGFAGDEPTNMAKGRWPVLDSPMTAYLTGGNGAVKRVESGELAPRQPLVPPPADFSKQRMMEVVRYLAAPELRGRGFGTAELDRASEFIAGKFREAGLQPAGDTDGSWFQTWTESGGEPERQVAMKNVVGILPGNRADWSGSSVVVGAHYDHLGTGWPDVREEFRGQVHFGADDNASGIAVLLELARVLGKSGPLDRTVVFVAFAGEEAGRRGSRHYVAAQGRFPVDRALGMVNLDTVGRLGNNPLFVLGAGSAREWARIFTGSGYVAGVAVTPIADDYGSSDQRSFLDAGVPAVQLFSGPNQDYHRPSDTPDKIDGDGLVKIAAVAKEAVAYLATRERPLTAALTERTQGGLSSAERRSVSLGTVPDFAYAGTGVRLSGTLRGSPAEQAGLRSGDVIVQVNATPIRSLRDLSGVLKGLNTGEKVSIRYIRDGKERAAQTPVVTR